MDFLESLKLSLSNLFSYKVRSFLTMLGIIIGIGAVIMMSSLGAGMKQNITGDLNKLGVGNFNVSIDTSPGQTYKTEDLMTEKDIENIKKIGGKNMEKTIQELINEHPKLMNDYKNQIINEIGNSEKEKIEAAIKSERERIKELDKIPTLNDKQKEIINKAKFEDPREPKDIMAEFFISNANKADQEIQAAKDDILKAGLDRIIPSNSDMGDNSVEDEIYKAALNAYNDEEK